VLHVRVISPPDATDAVVDLFDTATGVTNVVVMRGAARRPAGDLIMCDLAREAANTLIADLRRLGLYESGSITLENLEVAIARGADEAELQAPGDADDAVIWEELARRVTGDSQVTWAYLAFLTIATLIAAIGVLLPSLILIVGAMVLGPEFGAVAAICFGLLRRDWSLIGAAARTLVVGFATAIAITSAGTILAIWTGLVTSDMLQHHEEVEFIVKPDEWSFIVAVLAGAAGVLSITAGKSSALIGVFISVTTVPAAGYMAVAMALGQWSDVRGSLAQLLVNIAGMIAAGTVILVAQRFLWHRYGHRIPYSEPDGPDSRPIRNSSL
jgi:uncharacterized hydrophobic protein (TIGR00271 family)